jgi:hypothetical protein
MVTNTITEAEFRSDKEAVKALNDFLESPHGQKFCAALRGGSIIEVLTTSEKTMPHTIRPLAIAEGPNANMLLGMAEGYHLSLKLIDSLSQFEDKKTPKKESASHLGRVTSILNNKPEQ